jgi:large subunit ribosomal protein L4
MPKKIISIALSDALRFKMKEYKVAIFSDFGVEIKTSKISAVLESNKFSSALIVHDGSNLALIKSAKNLKGVKAIHAKAINVYDILNFDHILVDDKIFESKILGVIA